MQRKLAKLLNSKMRVFQDGLLLLLLVVVLSLGRLLVANNVGNLWVVERLHGEIFELRRVEKAMVVRLEKFSNNKAKKLTSVCMVLPLCLAQGKRIDKDQRSKKLVVPVKTL